MFLLQSPPSFSMKDKVSHWSGTSQLAQAGLLSLFFVVFVCLLFFKRVLRAKLMSWFFLVTELFSWLLTNCEKNTSERLPPSLVLNVLRKKCNDYLQSYSQTIFCMLCY